MQKKIVAFALTGAVVLGGGAAVAIPAFAADSSTSTDVTSRTDTIKDALKGLVDDETLTQAQADKVADALSQPGALPGGGPGGHGGPGGPGRGGLGFGGLEAGLDAAATVLGLSADEIRTALRDGTTLKELADKQGKSEDDLVNALVDAAKTKLADAVKGGKLTQERADEIEKNLPAQIKEFVENGGPRFGGRGPGGPGADGFKGGRGPGAEGQTPGATPSPGATSPTPGATPGATGSSTSFVPTQSGARV